MSQNDLENTKNETTIEPYLPTFNTDSALLIKNCVPLKHQVAGHIIGKENTKFGKKN